MELVSLGRQSIYEKENSETKPTGPPGLGVGRWANNPALEKTELLQKPQQQIQNTTWLRESPLQ